VVRTDAIIDTRAQKMVSHTLCIVLFHIGNAVVHIGGIKSRKF